MRGDNTKETKWIPIILEQVESKGYGTVWLRDQDKS